MPSYLATWLGASLLSLAFLPAPAQAHPDALRWQDSLNEATRDIAPHRRARAMALAWSAAFNAVNACTGRYQAYGSSPPLAPPPPACSAQPLMMGAALHTVLLLETQAKQAPLQKALDDAATGTQDREARFLALREGRRAALQLLLARADDRLDRAEPALRPAGPGVFVPPAAPRMASSARLASWTLFTRPTLTGLEHAAPPVPGSAAALRDLDELRRLGGVNSRDRSADQTAAALFWNSGDPGDDALMLRPWVALHTDSLVDALRVLALFALVDVDVRIVEIAFKDRHQMWRPETALGAEGWSPLVETPSSPDYPSGTALFGGAMQRLMERLPSTPDAWPLKSFNSVTRQTRRFDNAAQLAREAGEARIWAGAHHRSSLDAGWKLGHQLAEDALASLMPKR